MILKILSVLICRIPTFYRKTWRASQDKILIVNSFTFLKKDNTIAMLMD